MNAHVEPCRKCNLKNLAFSERSVSASAKKCYTLLVIFFGFIGKITSAAPVTTPEMPAASTVRNGESCRGKT